MRKPILLLLLILSFFNMPAQSFVMAKQFHGNDAQVCADAAADNSGNTYSAVNFWGTLDVDPGVPVVNFTSAGAQDVAIVKLNSAGNYVWGIQLTGTGFSTSSVIKTDAAGNVFIFGYFNGTIDADPTGATYNLVSAGGDDIFCAKYSAAGNLVWAVNTGGTGTEQNYGFDLDAAGNPVLHGYFQNTVDFNPGAGTFNLTAGAGGSDFLLKLNNAGTFVWALLLPSFWGNKTILDAADNIYITGEFWGTVDFDPGVGVHNLSAWGFGADAVVLKLNSAGNYLWAAQLSGNMDEQGTCIAVNETENTIVCAGFYQGTLDTDPGPGVMNLISAGYIDGFVVKLTAAAGSFVWSKNIGGLGWQSVAGLQIDISGNIHMTGPFEQTVDLDPSGGTFNLTSAGYTDIFRTVWTTAGSFATAEKIGNTGEDWPSNLEFDNEGIEMITGYFDGIVDFDPGAGVASLNSAFTGWDGFLAKYCTSYTINNDVAICAGESYFAGGAWQTVPGDYYDYYTPAVGCDSTVITHLTVNSPVVDLGADVAICNGTTTTLNAGNPGATYVWNTGATTQTISVSTAGNYSVTITDGAGCTAADAITVTVNPAPNVNLGPDISICAGETVVLNAGNPGATFLWNTGATTQTITVATTGNYSVTVTNGYGCTDNDLVHVSVNPIPVVDLGMNTGFCAGGSIVLDAENTGATYDWNTGASTQTITVSAAGTYSVIVTTAAGCSGTDSIDIAVYPQPDVALGADITVCADAVVILDAGNPGATYSWNTGATTQTINVTATGNYSVTVTNAYGCTDNDLIHVTINPLPVVDLGIDAQICENTPLLLDAENPGSTYTWSTGETTQQIFAGASGTYNVTVTNVYGCSTFDEITITTLTAPAVDLGPDQAFCEGGSALLDASIPLEDTYIWNTGASTATINATAGGTYFVAATNTNGCTAYDTVIISVYPLPEVDLILSSDEICSDSEPFALTGGTPEGGVYSGDGVAGGIFDPAAAGIGTHSIIYTYTNAEGCTDSATTEITVTLCNGVDELNAAHTISISPNPAIISITVQIENPTDFSLLELMDMTGRLMYAENILPHNKTLLLDVSGIPSGQYVITLRGENTFSAHPLLITK